MRKLVKESDSHCGVALSADGRAIVTVDNTGELVAPGELALFLAGYLARQYRQKGAVVVPRPASLTARFDLPLRLELALLAGIALTFLLDYLDLTVRNRAELEALGLPVLGEIPTRRRRWFGFK